MVENASFVRGLMVVLLAMVGAQAVHWFLTPANHPDASVLRTFAVGVQAAAGFGGALWVALRQRAAALR